MRFARQWLLEYLDAQPGAAEIATALTSVGLAVESFDEETLEVEVTPNRPDAMCHYGLARELAVKLRCRLVRPVAPPIPSTAKDVQVRIEDRADCPWYTASLIQGVKVGPSPTWMQERLRAVGVRPINNVVDVTNYVLWETGQPLHAFDHELVSGGIIVRRARAGETVVTLDGVERRLTPSILVIADDERAVGLAGVMGGEQEGVTEGTKSVLLESAHFARAAVRTASRTFDLHTDASHRFERGVDPAACAAAAARAAVLLAEVGGGSVRAVCLAQAGGPPETLPAGRLEHRRLERFGGFPIPPAEVERILRGLGFGVEGETVTVPSWRLYDLAPGQGGEVEEADLFEEVLRQVGLEATPATLPVLSGADAGRAPGHGWRERVRDHLAACGFAEAIDYAFVSRDQDASCAALVPGPALELANPLSESYAVLRRSLLPGLVDSARFNLRHGAGSVALFELGHLFSPQGETEAVAAVLGGGHEGREFDVFDLKGAIEGLATLARRAFEVTSEDLAGFATGFAGSLALRGGGGRVGHLGRLADPAGDDPFPLYVAEIVFDGWEGAATTAALSIPSRYPAIVMDLTLRHPLAVRWSEIAAAVEEARARTPEMLSFRLTDRYRGPGVPEGAVATTMRFVYQAQDRSLEQDEVNAWHQALLADLERRFAWMEGS